MRALITWLLLSTACFAQSVVELPVTVKVPVYDDAAIKARLDAIETRLNVLESGTTPPVDPPPIDPPPVGPPPPVDPPQPVPVGDEFFESLVSGPYHLRSHAYGSQEEIDSHSVNVGTGTNPESNENVVYDPVHDAGRLILRGSMPLTNRSEIRWSTDRKNTGHLAVIWDYMPSPDWDQSNQSIRTHKMFMLGDYGANDRRMLEQRFHYRRTDGLDGSNIDGNGDGLWLVDTRPYVLANRDGPGKGLDRVTPWTPAYAKVSEWNRFYADVDFTAQPSPVYSVWLRNQDGTLSNVYSKTPLPNVAERGGFDFFDPTWANTSQQPNFEAITHGWVRNAVVLWSETPMDLDGVRDAPIVELAD